MYNQQFSTLVVSLVDTDTNRIMANPGEDAGKGSQYIWLSKDTLDFFPPLDQKNDREKVAEYTLINLNYVDLNEIREERVTYEADNNMDVRLGTGRLRYSKIAQPGDLACITRTGVKEYQLRIIQQGSASYDLLKAKATTSIGHKGKKFGFLDNETFFQII
ncbi:hypothetical protein ABXK20_004213 [Serratia marcescens]|uniref:hypothetical protein n=1 Tax=Enterobacterales TaxID=91347 RepID=UPI00249F3FE0|nr:MULTISPECIES: hypothetical protein [Enterobacterales]MEB2852718.1 hypothetical protein [Klebsiella oxytoca]MEB2878944.1 hypothetical protein [Klebsiella oxytoca]WGZ62883.1 hypothetical protein SSARUM_004714 [Serratia sp. K-M0706]WPO23948.1 hypothetical protein SH582_23585 [Raoultella ornithinolytica]WRV61045.1 hypothetical protein VOT19_23580 [Serratia sp. K-M0228]